jgi:hypothetical protein
LELIRAFQAGKGGFEQIRARMNRKQERFPEIYRALGELAVEATKLESELTITLCQLLVGPIKDPKSINVDVVNAIASERRSFPQLADFVQKIFNAYVTDKDARKDLQSVLEEAKNLMKSRGQHIHGHWNLDYTTDKVAQLAHKAVYQSVDPEDLQAIVDKIKDCRLRILPTVTQAFRKPPKADEALKKAAAALPEV